ncbi:MAG: hypothetical protein NVS2B4_12170 [Ramlibacter sp.]
MFNDFVISMSPASEFGATERLAAFQDAAAYDDTARADVWLCETAQLDISHPKVRITAQKLTQALQTLPARAAAIHAFVRRMPFATSADSSTVRASEVLRRQHGDCHAKGVLFTALCRAAEIPARLLFVDVRARFLAGILDEGPAVLPHAVGQVLVDRRWSSTDGYVVDPALFARAKQLLKTHRLDCGWGIVAEAQGSWSGSGVCLHQFRGEDVLRAHGAYHDPAQFYASVAGPIGLAWLKYALGAHMVNRRVARIRQSEPVITA